MCREAEGRGSEARGRGWGRINGHKPERRMM